MPYYTTRWRRWRRRRPRWFRWRRPRGPFRRRYYRRHWVRNRKKKLSRITLKEWQPLKIIKTKVKGIYPFFLTTHKRISYNLIQYLDTVTPSKAPGGGGFSIMQFSLNGLYELFLKGQNIWTKSNCNLPLVRYNGCTMKLYRAELVDYVVTIQNCYPMCCSDLMYMSSQPAVMMMTHKSIFVPCRHNSNNRKKYKKIFIHPPSQMQTKWYFQSQLSNTPLILIKAVACSFDRYYLHSTAASTTIGFTSLNTTTFQLHNWKNFPPTAGYHPQERLYFWGSKQPPTSNPLDEKLGNLIYLGHTTDLVEGKTIKEKTTLQAYCQDSNAWGNIFHPRWLGYDYQVYSTNKSLSDIKQELATKNLDDKLSTINPQIFTPRTIPLQTRCRYNPLADKGIGNQIFLASVTSEVDTWHEPKNEKLMRSNFPLWILAWGWHDWQLKLAEVHRLDTEYVTVIKSPYIEPPLSYYIPLDPNFTEWPPLSPYITTLNEADSKNFFPKNNFQVLTLNDICTSGPGTVKLPPDKSCEAHFKYCFHLKFGGCPAKMEQICNPTDFPVYPIPNSKLLQPSLQSPTTPLQTYFYNFDERRQLITDRAAKRIKKDFTTPTTLLPIAGTAMEVQPPQETTSPSTTSTEEEEETTLELQLLQLRKKQKKLKQWIRKLLNE